MLPADMWYRDKTFFTMEECTTRKIQYKQRIDRAWEKDGAEKDTQMTFECRLGLEMLAQS